MKTANDTDDTIDGLRAARRREAEAEARRDPRWAELAMGSLSEDDAEDLRRASPDLYEIYRPFDGDEHERLVTAIAGRLAARAPASSTLAAGADPAPRTDGGAPVVSISGWRRARAPIAGALAAAAAIAVVVSQKPPPLELAWSEQRGGAASAPHLSSVAGSPHERLAEMIVPVTPIRGRVAVRGALLVEPGRTDPGRVRPWALAAEPTSENVIVISGTRRDLFPGVPRGEWDMVVAVGRPGPALSEDELLRLAWAGATGDVQVLKKRVVLEGPCVGTPERPCRDAAEAP
jgi:hypothetical protein